jgi:hypothetical protein
MWSRRRLHALGAEQVLDAERHAFEQAGLALGPARIGGLGHLAGLVRRFGDEGVERTIGSTLLVSTSFNCSIQAKMPESSPASGANSSSGTFRRASRAMRATVSLSSDITALQNAQKQSSIRGW